MTFLRKWIKILRRPTKIKLRPTFGWWHRDWEALFYNGNSLRSDFCLLDLCSCWRAVQPLLDCFAGRLSYGGEVVLVDQVQLQTDLSLFSTACKHFRYFMVVLFTSSLNNKRPSIDIVQYMANTVMLDCSSQV